MPSARNHFVGTVKPVTLGDVVTDVVVQVRNLDIVSAIARGSADSLQLKPLDTVKAAIKSTEVLIDK